MFFVFTGKVFVVDYIDNANVAFVNAVVKNDNDFVYVGF